MLSPTLLPLSNLSRVDRKETIYAEAHLNFELLIKLIKQSSVIDKSNS